MNEESETGNQGSTPPPLESVSFVPSHQGVGGWLILLILSLALVSPAIMVGTLISGYRASSKYFGQFPGLLVISVIETVLSLGVTAFGVYAGIGLWRVRPGAVQVTKRFLLCFLGYKAISAILPFMAGLPSAANGILITEAAKDMIKSIVFFAIWYSYLNNSQRVRATYEV